MTTLKKTPLFEAHIALGARMVPFAGFEMPVSYSGIIEEHTAVRERAGIFDVSHMGEFVVSGPAAFEYLDRLVTNNCSKLPVDGVLYTVMCRENGTVVDDLLVSRLAADRAMVVVNAANIDKDFRHMASMLPSEGVVLENKSDEYALLAVQGPVSRELLGSTRTFEPVKDRLGDIAYYSCFRFTLGDDEIIVSRTGYTGELGFEIFLPSGRARDVWEDIMSAGTAFGLSPVGLAARDTLRFEASFCLYGNELDDETTPLEAGLKWVVKFKKPGGFVGKDALLAERDSGPRKKLVGMELEGKNIARHGYAVMSGDEMVGRVTSGTFSPTLSKSLCMAYVDTDRLNDDSEYQIQIRKKMAGAKITPLPFYASRAR
ncbi:MAG: glycine cleavage system aminomethyltransferase GcvT [Candidatus Latescibacterota bacterium]|jgi:aminomethyltransferase